MCKAFNHNSDIFIKDQEPAIVNVDSLREAIKFLRMPELSKFELDTMLDEGTASMQKFGENPGGTDSIEDEESPKELKVSFLIAGSETFRKMVLTLVTDPIYCALVNTHLADLVSPKQLKLLSRGATEVKIGDIGSTLYSTKACNQEWFVLISGKLRIKVQIGRAHV